MASIARVRKPVPIEYVNRWKHRSLFDGGWLPVPKQFFELSATLRPKISRNGAMLLLHLMSFKWGDRPPFVKYDTLASRLGVTAKQVARDVRRLAADGYLVIEAREGRSNVFHLDPFLDILAEAYQRAQARKGDERAA